MLNRLIPRNILIRHTPLADPLLFIQELDKKCVWRQMKQGLRGWRSDHLFFKLKVMIQFTTLAALVFALNNKKLSLAVLKTQTEGTEEYSLFYRLLVTEVQCTGQSWVSIQTTNWIEVLWRFPGHCSCRAHKNCQSLSLAVVTFPCQMYRSHHFRDNEDVSLRKIIAESLWDTLLFIFQESTDYDRFMDRLLSILMTL